MLQRILVKQTDRGTDHGSLSESLIKRCCGGDNRTYWGVQALIQVGRPMRSNATHTYTRSACLELAGTMLHKASGLDKRPAMWCACDTR